jgi:hypothetical protein
MFSRYRLIHLLLPCAAICAAMLAGCASLGGFKSDTHSRPDTNTWYLIYGEGAKPNRVLYFAREGLNGVTIQGGKFMDDPVRHVFFVIVYESAKEPDLVRKMALVNCSTHQYSEEGRSSAQYRNTDLPLKDVTLHGSQPINTPALEQLYRFACDTKADLESDNEFQKLGSVPDTLTLVDLAWATPWKDGTRPPYTTSVKTKEQAMAMLKKLQKTLDQEKRQVTKQRDEAQATVNNVYLKGTATPQERLKIDSEKTKSQYLAAQRATQRRSKTINPTLETWIGATEAQILTGWGGPSSIETDSNMDRLLAYGFDSTSALVTQGGAVVSSSTYTCTIIWRIHDGVAVDYRWKGSSPFGSAGVCQDMHLKIGIGPHPENM